MIGFCDDSVQARTTRDANPGCDSRKPEPGSPPSEYDYDPQGWMPGGGPGSRPIHIDAARYATTRLGLSGVDFTGPEAFPQQAR